MSASLPSFAESAIEGEWRIDRAASDDVGRAIQSATAKMNAFTRPIARRRLARTNPVYERVSLRFTPSSAHVTAGPSTLDLPASGAAIRWQRDGETLQVSGRLRGNEFIETFDAKDGRRTNVFSPRAGDTLAMTVTVTSPRLPKPLTYRLVYRR